MTRRQFLSLAKKVGLLLALGSIFPQKTEAQASVEDSDIENIAKEFLIKLDNFAATINSFPVAIKGNESYGDGSGRLISLVNFEYSERLSVLNDLNNSTQYNYPYYENPFFGEKPNSVILKKALANLNPGEILYFLDGNFIISDKNNKEKKQIL